MKKSNSHKQSVRNELQDRVVFAAIDVGSNTVRMLLGDVARGNVLPAIYRREMTRLKGGQSSSGLASEGMQKTIAALGTFQKELQKYSPTAITIVGTEALRTAANADHFTGLVRQETGFDLRVITGQEEAWLSARGALSVIDPAPKNAVIVDIGGGSTEIVLVDQGKVVFRHSCPLGVVRLAEMQPESTIQDFIDSNINQLTDQLSQDIYKLAKNPGTSLIGTAGTITTLAALDLKMESYDWRRVNNHRMTVKRLSEIEQLLAPLSISQRELLPGMETGRGDLILPGLTVLGGLLNSFAKEEFIVSDFGLLEGLLLQLAETTAIH